MSDRVPISAFGELRALIVSKLPPGQESERAATAVMELFYDVKDEWDDASIGTYGDPGRRLRQRALVCRVHRESHIVPGPPRPNRAMPSGLSHSSNPGSSVQPEEQA